MQRFSSIARARVAGTTNSKEACTAQEWFTATRTGNVNGAEGCLLRAPHLADHRDDLGCTALINAAANSHVPMCKYLVQEGADVNARCRSGNTALVYASMHGDIELVKFLHKKGALIDHESGKSGKTALDQAAAHGHLDVVKYLHALEVSLHDSWSGNELMWAAAHDQSDMIKAHIGKGADIEIKDDYGNTALLWAARQGGTKAVKALLSAGADLHAQTNSGWQALTQAAYHGKVDTLKVLQIAGAAVDGKDKIGWTASLWAAAQGHVEILSFLKSAGADLAVTGAGGWTPLMVAVAEDRVAAAKYLLRRGVSWRTLTDQGKTCEEIGCERNPAGELCELFGNMRRSVEYEEKRGAGNGKEKEKGTEAGARHGDEL